MAVVFSDIVESTAPVSAAVSRGLLWRMLGAPHPMAAHRADSAAIFDLGRKSAALRSDHRLAFE